MGKHFLYTWVFLLSFLAKPALATTAQESCTPSTPQEPQVYRDAKIFHSKAELKDQFLNLYQSERRLKNRVHFDPAAQSYLLPYRGGLVQIPNSFLYGVARHIELALENSYVDFVSYPDMGHGHLSLPTTEWEKIKRVQNHAERMKEVLNSPNLKVLYHTAELLQIKEGDFASGDFPQDPWKLWRYFSRNLLGDFGQDPRIEVLFAGVDQLYNTVRSLPDHTQVTTFYFSSTKRGCLGYSRGSKTLYFDLTFEGPSYPPPPRRNPKFNQVPKVVVIR